MAWLPERSLAQAFGSGAPILAGDDDWIAELTLSVFAAPAHLDRTGLKIRDYFRGLADGPGVAG